MAPPHNTRNIDISLLISEVKKRPILWDIRCESFKNKPLKAEAWISLCDAVLTDSVGKSDDEKQVLGE